MASEEIEKISPVAELEDLKRELESLREEKKAWTQKNETNLLEQKLDALVKEKFDKLKLEEQNRVMEAKKILAEAEENQKMQLMVEEGQKYQSLQDWKNSLKSKFKVAVDTFVSFFDNERQDFNFYNDFKSSKDHRDLAEMYFYLKKFGSEKAYNLFLKGFGVSSDNI